jgi:hypothetical protein
MKISRRGDRHMRTTTKIRLLAGALAFAGLGLMAQTEPAVDRCLPTLDQLGSGWLSNTVVALIDPLSSPIEMGTAGYLESARRRVKAGGCEAHAAIRYVYGASKVWIWAWFNRYPSPVQIPPGWGRDPLTKTTPENMTLPQAGDEVRFSQRDGMHNDFTFRRGNFLVCVEGVSAPLEKLRQLAEVIDQNILKARTNAARHSPTLKSTLYETKPKQP